MATRSGNRLRARDVPSAAQVERDQAIRRIGLTRRAVIGAAAALTAGLAALVSAIAPGKTFGSSRKLQTTVPTAPVKSARTTPTMPPLASASSLGLVAGSAPRPAPSQAPAQTTTTQQQQAPAPAQQAPVQQAPVQQAPPVVSGGS